MWCKFVSAFPYFLFLIRTLALDGDNFLAAGFFVAGLFGFLEIFPAFFGETFAFFGFGVFLIFAGAKNCHCLFRISIHIWKVVYWKHGISQTQPGW